MRFRPANISLINRRHYLPRLLLTLSSKRQIQKPHQRFEDVDRVTPYQGSVADQPGVVNTPLPTNVYHVAGILRAWLGPATEVTCSRQAFDPGL